MKVTFEGNSATGREWSGVIDIDDVQVRQALDPVAFITSHMPAMIAKAASFTIDTSPLPRSVSTSEVVIMGVCLIVHHLENGQRVIEADSLRDLLEEMGGAELPEAEQAKLREAMGNA